MIQMAQHLLSRMSIGAVKMQREGKREREMEKVCHIPFSRIATLTADSLQVPFVLQNHKASLVLSWCWVPASKEKGKDALMENTIHFIDMILYIYNVLTSIFQEKLQWFFKNWWVTKILWHEIYLSL